MSQICLAISLLSFGPCTRVVLFINKMYQEIKITLMFGDKFCFIKILYVINSVLLMQVTALMCVVILLDYPT